jgi:pimeloyl-ACP methyl ester carboxylesterase
MLPRVATEELAIDAGGMRFGALAWGEPDAPLALLLHGYPDSAWTWRHVGPRLAERGWRALAPFLPGYAPSDPAPGGRYRIAELAALICALHDALGGDSSAALLGHDWGAVLVWALSAHQPRRFGRWAALSVPPPSALLTPFASPATVPLGLRQLRMSWYFVYNQIPGVERDLDRVIAKLWRDWSPGYDAAEDLAHVRAALPDVDRRRAALDYYRQNLRGGLASTLRLHAGAAPVLYLHGEQDGCMSVQLAELAAERLPPNSRFEPVPGVGHFMALEDPAQVLGRLEPWLGPPPSAV